MHPLILKCAMALRRFWRRRDGYDGVADGVVVGRVFLSPTAPGHRPWMWTSNEHKGRPPEPTREAAIAAFAKSWRRQKPALAIGVAGAKSGGGTPRRDTSGTPSRINLAKLLISWRARQDSNL